jgi:hypothetical protein
MYMQRTTSSAACNGLHTTIKYMRGAAGIDLGTTIKHLRRTTSGAAGNGVGATMKCLRSTTSAAANNGLSTTIIPPCTSAPFEEELRAPQRGTSLAPFVCKARACSLCSLLLVDYQFSHAEKEDHKQILAERWRRAERVGISTEDHDREGDNELHTTMIEI